MCVGSAVVAITADLMGIGDVYYLVDYAFRGNIAPLITEFGAWLDKSRMIILQITPKFFLRVSVVKLNS